MEAASAPETLESYVPSYKVIPGMSYLQKKI
jgi:hypothetical protein